MGRTIPSFRIVLAMEKRGGETIAMPPLPTTGEELEEESLAEEDE